MQVRIHARFEHGQPAQLAEFGRVRLVIEGARYQHIEGRIGSFARRGHQIRALHRAEFRTDEKTRPSFGFPFHVPPFGAHQHSGPGFQRRERDPIFFMGLLHARRFQIVEDHFGEGHFRACSWQSVERVERIDHVVVFIHAEHAMGFGAKGAVGDPKPQMCNRGLRLSTVKGPATRTLRLSS